MHGVGYALEAGREHARSDAVSSLKVKLGLLVAVVGRRGRAARAARLRRPTSRRCWSLPVTVALALGVTQLLAAGMTAPLREMTEAARRMARGDYSGRVRTSATDEVGELARAFNPMAEDLATRRPRAPRPDRHRLPRAAHAADGADRAAGEPRRRRRAAPDADHLGAALDQAERLGRLVDDLLELSRLEAGVVDLDRPGRPAARAGRRVRRRR